MKKLILPAVVIVMAVTSAFTTDFQSQKSVDSTFINGHKRLSSTNPKLCEELDECQIEVTSTVCRVGQVSTGDQLWRMNANNECILPLYKPAN